MKRALAIKLALQCYVYRAIENILNVSQGVRIQVVGIDKCDTGK